MERTAQFSTSLGRPLHVRPCGATHQHVAETRVRLRTPKHFVASTSSRCWQAEAAACRCRARKLQVSAALFEPPPFQPSKLTVQYLSGATSSSNNGCTLWASFPATRRYTLTHNDVTGALQLSIGSDYNQRQVQGFYTRILRDEITAEWYFTSGASAPAELHIYCHVSGEERWLAPPQLRNFIFRREMTLVLDTFAYADRDFLQAFPELMQAKVYVHFQSDVQNLDLREFWGVFGDRTSWRRMPRGVLARLKLLLFGFPALPHQRPRSTLTRLQQLQEQQRQQQQQGAVLVPAAAAATAVGSSSISVQADQQELAQQPCVQQQQWHPTAGAAVELTRPVASPLDELRRLHPGAQQPVWQDAAQAGYAASNSEQQDVKAQQAQQQWQQQREGLPTVQQQAQQAALIGVDSSSSSSSSDSASYHCNSNDNGNSVHINQSQCIEAAAAADPGSAGQQGCSSVVEQDQVQQLQEASVPESVEVLQDYGFWFRPGAQQQQAKQVQQQEHRQLVLCNSSSKGNSNSSSMVGSTAGSNILPIVVLNDNRQLHSAVRPQQQQALGVLSAAPVSASSSSSSRNCAL